VDVLDVLLQTALVLERLSTARDEAVVERAVDLVLVHELVLLEVGP
jgi:hypothetical protein